MISWLVLLFVAVTVGFEPTRLLRESTLTACGSTSYAYITIVLVRNRRIELRFLGWKPNVLTTRREAHLDANGRSRTDDTMVMSHPLYYLSYVAFVLTYLYSNSTYYKVKFFGNFVYRECCIFLAERIELAPITDGVKVHCSTNWATSQQIWILGLDLHQHKEDLQSTTLLFLSPNTLGCQRGILTHYLRLIKTLLITLKLPGNCFGSPGLESNYQQILTRDLFYH